MEKKEIIGRNPVLEYLRTCEPGQDAELFISNTAHGKIIDVIADEARRALSLIHISEPTRPY